MDTVSTSEERMEKMNDELNHEVASKTVALTFRAARLTKETLEKALKKYLESR